MFKVTNTVPLRKRCFQTINRSTSTSGQPYFQRVYSVFCEAEVERSLQLQERQKQSTGAGGKAREDACSVSGLPKAPVTPCVVRTKEEDNGHLLGHIVLAICQETSLSPLGAFHFLCLPSCGQPTMSWEQFQEIYESKIIHNNIKEIICLSLCVGHLH